MKQILRKQHYFFPPEKKLKSELKVHVQHPLSVSVPLVLKELNTIRVLVLEDSESNKPFMPFLWLEWFVGDPNQFLFDGVNKDGTVGDGLSTYDSEKEVVLLRTQKRGQGFTIYQGAFRIHEMPDFKKKDVVGTPFALHVPKNLPNNNFKGKDFPIARFSQELFFRVVIDP